MGRLAADFETWSQRALGTEDIRYLFSDGWYPCAPPCSRWSTNPGLHMALRAQWPTLAIQRCTVHKLRSLQAKAPVRLREEIAEDYRRMIYGETREAVEKARVAFTKKWRLRCAPVVASLAEAGDELFTFLRFPASQWKALRTNALERINEEFRRRTKTQGLLPSEDAVLLLLFGLLRSGQIKLRRLDGWQDIPHSVPITGKAA